MKKLNNKGMTLIELIVSFALVCVAVIYFYQTLTTVYKLYNDTRKKTNEYVNWNYAFRIVDKGAINDLSKYGADGFTCYVSGSYYKITYDDGKTSATKYLFK